MQAELNRQFGARTTFRPNIPTRPQNSNQATSQVAWDGQKTFLFLVHPLPEFEPILPQLQSPNNDHESGRVFEPARGLQR